MIIRVGVEGGRQAVLRRARELNAPLMVSANSLWDDNRKRFGGWHCYAGFDVALDSGGFVAMKKYGRYRWGTHEYAQLAKAMGPTWWAQMDFCCEPEIAADGRAVLERIAWTANHLAELIRISNGEGIAAPMPVLQGWMPSDYCRGPIYEGLPWPKLVGVGSVCRRQVEGRDGVMAVIEAINRSAPPGVHLHLFGVKSAALRRLRQEFPERVASMDSMAWNVQARWDSYHGTRSGNSEARGVVMGEWYLRQTASMVAAEQQRILKL